MEPLQMQWLLASNMGCRWQACMRDWYENKFSESVICMLPVSFSVILAHARIQCLFFAKKGKQQKPWIPDQACPRIKSGAGS